MTAPRTLVVRQINHRIIAVRMGAVPEIRKRKRRIKVDAIVVGGWAWHASRSIHDTPIDGWWTVTHVRSGLAAFTKLWSERAAESVARLFAERFAAFKTKADVERLGRAMNRSKAWSEWMRQAAAGKFTKPPARAPRVPRPS